MLFGAAVALSSAADVAVVGATGGVGQAFAFDLERDDAATRPPEGEE